MDASAHASHNLSLQPHHSQQPQCPGSHSWSITPAVRVNLPERVSLTELSISEPRLCSSVAGIRPEEARNIVVDDLSVTPDIAELLVSEALFSVTFEGHKRILGVRFSPDFIPTGKSAFTSCLQSLAIHQCIHCGDTLTYFRSY